MAMPCMCTISGVNLNAIDMHYVIIINPRRMRGGYGSHRVCVYLSVSALTAIYLIHKCRVRCYTVPYGV